MLVFVVVCVCIFIYLFFGGGGAGGIATHIIYREKDKTDLEMICCGMEVGHKSPDFSRWSWKRELVGIKRTDI